MIHSGMLVLILESKNGHLTRRIVMDNFLETIKGAFLTMVIGIALLMSAGSVLNYLYPEKGLSMNLLGYQLACLSGCDEIEKKIHAPLVKNTLEQYQAKQFDKFLALYSQESAQIISRPATYQEASDQVNKLRKIQREMDELSERHKLFSKFKEIVEAKFGITIEPPVAVAAL